MCKALYGDDRENIGSSLVNWKFDQEIFRKYCARMIIMDELPFRVVEHERFKDFCSAMQPQFQVPSGFIVSNHCYEFYLSEKNKLFMYLKSAKQRVSLTTDIWTSR
ncbi:hypothetical protein REPUB_Repub17cG0025900 [Reevesia pubescens]